MENNDVVKSYKSIVLEKFKGKLELKTIDLRKLEKDEILVKVMASTIMPADLAMLQGTYGSFVPKCPIIPGMEGSGIIIDVGESVDKSLIGKHCSCVVNTSHEFYHGCWSEYMITLSYLCNVFESKISFDKIFNASGNPLTAIAMLDEIKRMGKKSVAQNGASTAYGRMFMRLCIENGIDIVNIVRKESTIKELTLDGGKYFVNTSDKNWETNLTNVCEELDITLLFDCCGGDITGKCLSAIKSGGTLYHFGNLELKRLGSINPYDFITNKKKMRGFWLASYLNNKELLEKAQKTIRDDFELNNGKIFSTDYTDKFTLDNIEKAFEFYLTKGGKILITPNN